MKFPWFKQYGIIFIPSSLMGWLTALMAVVYSIYKFIDIDSRSHSASDTLINFAFYLLITGAIYSAIAFVTSRKNGKAS